MILQNIQFPSSETCLVNNLYFNLKNTDGYIFQSRSEVQLNRYGVVTADTYFNSFPIEQWKKYTVINNLGLELILKGDFVIKLLNITLINNKPVARVLNILEFHTLEKNKVSCDFQGIDYNGILCFQLEALSTIAIFYGGGYSSDVAPELISKVDLAIAMCTYRREDYVIENMDLLKKYIFNNDKSELSGHLNVYISDNGKSLDINTVQSPYIRIFPNRNTGGSGGFTRAFIELLNDSRNDYTHILVMDDDIKLSIDVLNRTFTFLRLLKTEFKNIILGSAFLNIDFPYEQVENGGNIKGGYPVANGTRVDLTNLENILSVAKNKKLDYLGWWYCAIPKEFLARELPLPLFIKRDDVEFCLRWKVDKVVVNGICVWHEPYMKKFNLTTQYYNCRNNLIMNAIHNPSFNAIKLKKEVKNKLKEYLLTYRYIEMELYLQGINDFLQGLDWLKGIDAEKLNTNLREGLPTFQPIDKINPEFKWIDYIKNTSYSESKVKKWVRRLTLNGAILKPRYHIVAPMVGAKIGSFWRVKKAIFFNSFNNMAYESKRDNKRAIKILRKSKRIMKSIDENYNEVVSEYRNRYRELVTVEFWKCFLDV